MVSELLGNSKHETLMLEEEISQNDVNTSSKKKKKKKKNTNAETNKDQTSIIKE